MKNLFSQFIWRLRLKKSKDDFGIEFEDLSLVLASLVILVLLHLLRLILILILLLLLRIILLPLWRGILRPGILKPIPRILISTVSVVVLTAGALSTFAFGRVWIVWMVDLWNFVVGLANLRPGGHRYGEEEKCQDLHHVQQ